MTAAYLARAGLRTLVLEPRERVGGQALTTELVPGIRVPTLAHTVGRLSPAIVRELDLRRHGLSLLTPEARVFAPTPDGDAITLWAEPERTAAELRDRSPSDADAWPAFDRHVRSLARFLATLAAAPPPEIRSPGAVDALLGLRVGWVFRSLPRPDRQELLRALPMAVADFVSDWLADDALRAVVAWRGVRFSALGTRSAGTTAWLLTDSTGADAGAAGEVILARGGPGALAEALALAARSAGAEIRTGAEVVAVTTDGERVTGVALADGEEIRAPVVAAALDPKRLLTGLLDPAV
ncbi:MAG TPA: FAD-dependent oxidoreductase, partial [Candidatus Limnocylindrales bacterium]|nr:FAD-dependent oxidoreductase [Candidatus Limnocylindrales bacterium]